jgi:glycolate oxidase
MDDTSQDAGPGASCGYTHLPVDVSLHRSLVEALGPDAVLDGGAVLVPADAEGVVAVLRIAQEHRLSLRLTSGLATSSRSGPGGAVLSLGNLAAISVDSLRGITRAEAGATLSALGTALANAGMAVPGLASPPGSDHVGALIARGQLPRRSLIGIEAALPGGDLVMLGASVLKDVVGYDVTSLLLGSCGRLAAIVAAHLRLVPAAAVVAVAEPAGVRSVDELAGVFDPQGVLAGS